MSAAPRSIQAAPSLRPLVAAFAAVLLATALVLALAYGQLGGSRAISVTTSGSSQVMHDHGWSTAPAAGPATGGGNGTRFAR